jgi:hypothetical protein
MNVVKPAIGKVPIERYIEIHEGARRGPRT